jgi:hypothetical protein
MDNRSSNIALECIRKTRESLVPHLVLIDREVPTSIHELFASFSSNIRITPIQGSKIGGSVSSLYDTPSVVMGVPNKKEYKGNRVFAM